MIRIINFTFSLIFIFTLAMNNYVIADEVEQGKIRVATFNVSMEARQYKTKPPFASDLLFNKLSGPDFQHGKNIAAIIQRTRPDVLLLNEFDFVGNRAAIALFLQKYLSVSQRNQLPIHYPYVYVAPVNTGVISDYDLNNDGQISLPNDAWGFGYFPGHYGMALLSRYPIDYENVRTFQHFKWSDMPNALKPFNAETNNPYYPEHIWQKLRLSSKSHWDIPIKIDDHRVLHVLAAHPVPPVFDGQENRNGRRNHDELRLLADYVSNRQYIYDDENVFGGLAAKSKFVMLGDFNADPLKGESLKNGIGRLTHHPLINADCVPTNGDSSDTTSWKLRVDYVLPSNNLSVKGCGIFWPSDKEPLAELMTSRDLSSDHRLVWLDLFNGPW